MIEFLLYFRSNTLLDESDLRVTLVLRVEQRRATRIHAARDLARSQTVAYPFSNVAKLG
jgi:hypothetical protein